MNDSYTTVRGSRRVNQIVRYLGWVYAPCESRGIEDARFVRIEKAVSLPDRAGADFRTGVGGFGAELADEAHRADFAARAQQAEASALAGS